MPKTKSMSSRGGLRHSKSNASCTYRTRNSLFEHFYRRSRLSASRHQILARCLFVLRRRVLYNSCLVLLVHAMTNELPQPDPSLSPDSSAWSPTSSFSPPPFSHSDDASSVTSEDWERAMQSPSPAPSVYSLTSSLREQSFRREYGRELNNYSEVYRLPADDEELERLSE